MKAPETARIDMPVCQAVNCERQSNGRIKMSTATKNATIYYSINGGEYQKYSTLLNNNDACTISAYCEAEGMMASPVMTYDFPLFISKTGWKLVSADSQHGGNEARLAFDGKNDTFWHTEWGANEPKCPHTIIIDMVNVYNVTGITYLSRQDGNQNGMVKAYEVYLSQNGTIWGTAVATGEFKNTTSQQVATLTSPVIARYLKFVAKSEINGNAWTSAAEIGILADRDFTSVLPVTGNRDVSAAVYNLQGHRMTSNEDTWPKGIYLTNGRKIIR
jgi:beta-galactosidase